MAITNRTANDRDDASNEDELRTGPNIDNGINTGRVTVDPHTAAGLAAAASRDAHGAKTKQRDDGLLEVTDAPMGAPAPDTGKTSRPESESDVPDSEKAAYKANKSTIANTKDDIKADPKADVQ